MYEVQCHLRLTFSFIIDLMQVEEVACKFVLMLGAGWAWPLKPVLVTILFCIHGTVSAMNVLFSNSLIVNIMKYDITV